MVTKGRLFDVEYGMKKINDAIVNENDVLLFHEGNWLNDQCIHFYEMYIQNMVCGENKILFFMDPCVVAYLRFQMEQMDVSIEGYELVLIPINNSMDRLEMGTHWSLLVYDRTENSWRHYDSSVGDNGNLAIAKQVSLMFDESSVVVDKEDCPKQSNGYDCGMFVLLCMEYLAKRYIGDTCGSLKEYVNEDRIKEYRTKKIMDILKSV